MPFKRFKRIASKNKKTPQEAGESSNPPTENQTSRMREFLATKLTLLANQFSIEEITWLIRNNDTKVGVLIDNILATEAEKRPPPKKDLPDDCLDHLLRKDYHPEGDSSHEEETVSIRYCKVCEDFGMKKDMVKCRKCGHWYHTWCADEPERKGGEDPYFSFWLCPKCKPDPKLFPGYKFTYRSKAEIDTDKRYEDIDSDEPDF